MHMFPFSFLPCTFLNQIVTTRSSGETTGLYQSFSLLDFSNNLVHSNISKFRRKDLVLLLFICSFDGEVKYSAPIAENS